MKPITISIPIPKSKWWENSFVLLDKNHNPHIFQSSPLSYWEDGSIKWVLIEFLSNIKPKHIKLTKVSVIKPIE